MSTAPRTSRFISNAAIMPSALCSSTPTHASGSLSLLLGHGEVNRPSSYRAAVQPPSSDAGSPLSIGLGGGPPLPQYVRLWHKADMLKALMNVRFWRQSGRPAFSYFQSRNIP